MGEVITNDAPAEALQAWEIAGFSLVSSAEVGSWGVRISPLPCGREGYLPYELFAPTGYAIEPGRVAATGASLTFQDRWRATHAPNVFERYLGNAGDRVIGYIGVETIIMAGLQHRATEAWTAARIGVEENGSVGLSETTFSVWDNGRNYPSFGAMVNRFLAPAPGSKVSYCPKLRRPVPRTVAHMDENAFGDFITNTAVGVFKGSLTVISGERRLDITQNEGVVDFQETPTEPISGNLIVARMPHISLASQQAISDERRARKARSQAN